MANVNQVYGLVPYRTVNGADQNMQIVECATASTDGTAIFVGDPVKLAGGTDASGYTIVSQCAATNAIYGVVVGIKVDGDKLNVPYREASGTRHVYVNIDPNTIYIAQADEALAIANATKNASIVVGSGSTVTGLSGVQVDASTAATTAGLELALLGFPLDSANTPAAVYNKVLCKINLSQLADGRTGV